jgi:hypothetical protein
MIRFKKPDLKTFKILENQSKKFIILKCPYLKMFILAMFKFTFVNISKLFGFEKLFNFEKNIQNLPRNKKRKSMKLNFSKNQD